MALSPIFIVGVIARTLRLSERAGQAISVEIRPELNAALGSVDPQIKLTINGQTSSVAHSEAGAHRPKSEIGDHQSTKAAKPYE